MLDNDQLLGPAELHIVKEIRDSIEHCQQSSQKLADLFGEIELDNLEEVMLDSQKKDTLITLLEQFNGLERNLDYSQLVPMIAAVIVKPKNDRP